MRRIDRFDEYMKYSGLNDNKVTNQLGLSIGILGKSRKEGRDLSDRVVEKILKFYGNLNHVWLLTGEGEMLSNVQVSEGNTGSGIVGNNVQGGGISNNNVSGGGISQNDEGIMHKLLDIIREKDAALASKDAQIERLLDIILKEHAPGE